MHCNIHNQIYNFIAYNFILIYFGILNISLRTQLTKIAANYRFNYHFTIQIYDNNYSVIEKTITVSSKNH